MATIRNNLELSDRTAALIQQIEGNGNLDRSVAESSCFSLRQAIRESNMPNPNRWTLIDHLEDAARALSGSGHEPLVRELMEAAERLNTV